MAHLPFRTPTIAVLSIALAGALGGCAVDGPAPSGETQIPGRLITQEVPAPDHSVYYWSALRACLQTGRSEWECKSGEDRFVRDALAIEAELSARRQQRRQEMLSRARFPATGTARTAPGAGDEPPRSRSLMFEEQQEPAMPEIPIDPEWETLAKDASDGPATR